MCTVRRLGVNDAERESVFGGDDVVRRFKFIDSVYRRWIELKRGAGECDEDIYDVIDSKLSAKYNVESFLADYRFIVSTDRGALGYDELKDGDDGKEEDVDSECNVNGCFIVERSERNRARMTRNEQKRKSLFFVSRQMEEDGASRHSVVIQQILDSAHIWCRHTLRVKADQYIDAKLGDDDDDEVEVDWSCTDRLIQEFGALIERKKKSSNRFRSTQSERATSNGSKFMTMSTEDIQSAIGSHSETAAVSGPDAVGKDTKDTAASFQEEIVDEVRGTVLSHDGVRDFYEFIEAEQFDTDGLRDDLQDHSESNVVLLFGDKETRNGKGLEWVLRKRMFEDAQRDNLYSSGFRYFYWKHYEFREEEWDVLYTQPNGQPLVEGNEGYKLCDFYVAPKWSNLKEEAINNDTLSFSRSQFEDLVEKATAKLLSWSKDSKARELGAQSAWLEQYSFCEKAFGIKRGAPIKVEHIVALLMYTDFTEHSRLFSASFRKSSPYEAVSDLVARHRQYHHWGKLLRELVEAYGEEMGKRNDIGIFYHGVSAAMIFDSTTIRLRGPVSTTASLVSISIISCLTVCCGARLFE